MTERSKDRRHQGRDDSAEWRPHHGGAEVEACLSVPPFVEIKPDGFGAKAIEAWLERDGDLWRLHVKARVS